MVTNRMVFHMYSQVHCMNLDVPVNCIFAKMEPHLTFYILSSLIYRKWLLYQGLFIHMQFQRYGILDFWTTQELCNIVNWYAVSRVFLEAIIPTVHCTMNTFAYYICKWPENSFSISNEIIKNVAVHLSN